MKLIAKFFALAIVMIAFSLSSFGQANATAVATATIITPISIAKNVGADLLFGNLAVNAVGGTVALSAAAIPVRTPTAGVTLPAVTGTVGAATFTVTGQTNATYVVSLPADGTVTLTGPGANMPCNTFVHSLGGPGNLGAGGSQVFYVGATLTVNGSQGAGSYTSAPFTVTVNYN